MPLQRVRKRLSVTVDGDRLIAFQPQQFDQLFNQRRIVLVPDPKCIARLVTQTGITEIDFNMPHVFLRGATGNFLINRQARCQRCLFGIRAGVNIIDCTRRGDGSLRWGLFRHARFQHVNDARTPFSGGGLVFHIRINAVQQALSAQFRQFAVEIFTGLAEKFVGGVAQAKHGERRPVQFWGFFREQEFMQGHRFFSRLTLTLG